MMFTGLDTILTNLDAHEEAIYAALRDLATQYAPILASDAQANAPWQDQTGAARRRLNATIEEESGTVRLWLSHGVDYGLFLETRHAGRFAIVQPTLERRSPEIIAAMQQRFSR